MNALKIYLLFLISGFFFSFLSLAHAVELSPNYLSGPEVCKKNSSFVSKELGTFLQVPIDYKNRELGNTPLYFWTLTAFNSEKSTILFVNGGPGGSSHKEEFSAPFDDFNLVYFDQRGVNCSKPPTQELYLSSSFYSSEIIAQDIEEIRKSLGVSQLTIYGHSYGTVPATIYASLYPGSTHAVVLEGTVFAGGAALFQSDYTRGMIQATFKRLSPEIQKEILKYSKDPRVSANWFSRLAKYMMAETNSFMHINRWLSTIFDPDLKESLINNLNSFSHDSVFDPEFGSSLVFYAMLACQELGQNSPEASFYSVFNEKGQLVSDQDVSSQIRLCRELNVPSGQLYSATRFPVQVPVTYFQGETDSATIMPEARKHFEQVPRGFAQILILQDGGHLSNMNFLKNFKKDKKNHQIQSEIFVQAALGKPIKPELINEFNSNNEQKWQYNQKLKVSQ